jgi:peptidoglycan/xylan/chitin deacetylase (PgdA/CDA1 family)
LGFLAQAEVKKPFLKLFMKQVFLFLFLTILLLVAGVWVWPPAPPKMQTITSSTPTPTSISVLSPTPTPKPTISYINDGPCKNIPILMYHHVNSYTGDQKTSASLTVSAEVFAGQLDYLLQKGYSVVSLDDLANAPPKSLVITFDDGYEDNYQEAFPLLRARRLKATIFLATGLVESSPRYLTWPQIREMQSSGLVTFGNHTWSHPSLVNKSRDLIFQEIKTAQDQILSFTGRPAAYFAYPYGGNTALIESILTELGFKGAVVTFNRWQCEKKPYQLGRLRIGNAPLSVYGL